MCTSSSRTSLLLAFVPFDRFNANRRKKNMFINLVNCTSIHSFNIHSQCRRVHGKTTYEWHTDDIRVTYGWHTSTYEWHTDDIRVHTSDIRMAYEYIRVAYEYIRVTYGWHKITYEWHTNDIRIHTSDIRMTYEYIRVTYGWHTSTYEWHANDIRVHTSDLRMTYRYMLVTYRWHAVRKKNKLFKTFLIILFQNIRFVKEFLACNGCFGLFTKIKKGD